MGAARRGARGIVGRTIPIVPYLPSAAHAQPPGRPERVGVSAGAAPQPPHVPPRPWHRHNLAGEAKTSCLLEMALPASLHTPSSLQRQIKRNPGGGESLREGQGAGVEQAESWGRCQPVAGHQSSGVGEQGQPPKWYTGGMHRPRASAQHPTQLPAGGGTGSIRPTPGHRSPCRAGRR